MAIEPRTNEFYCNAVGLLLAHCDLLLCFTSRQRESTEIFVRHFAQQVPSVGTIHTPKIEPRSARCYQRPYPLLRALQSVGTFILNY